MEPDNDLSFLHGNKSTDWQVNSFASAVRNHNQPSKRYNQVPCKFSVGDLVRLRGGQAPQRVVEVRDGYGGYQIRCDYLTSRKQNAFRHEADFIAILDIDTETKEEDPMKGKLFQTLDGSVYGEGLVIDGDGKYVLKLNNGEYKAYASTELKRVMPFTFDAVYSGMAGKRYSFLGKAGSVEVGDILMDAKDFTILRVVAVGTESDSATKTFEGVKLKVEALV